MKALLLATVLALLTAPIASAQNVTETFDTQFNAQHISPDGLFQIAGKWTGTGGNLLDPANAVIAGGQLKLSVSAGVKTGAEIQSLPGKNGFPQLGPGWGYGYYEARMKVTPVSGTVASIFWVEAPNYGPHEWDVEFLTDESPRTKVHFTRHPSNATFIYDLGFDWSAAFHRYGFLWTPGRLDFTVDRVIVHTMTDPEMGTGAKGFLMANVWTGNPNWGGGPPTSKTTTAYEGISFKAGATSIPPP